MKYYQLDDLLVGPIKYLNVQKLFRLLYMDGQESPSLSLESAVDYFHLKKEDNFHRAVNDAAYTADVFRQMDMEEAWKLYSIDYYQNPKEKQDEIHLTYDSYYKYISREFESKEQTMEDREVRSTRCYKCGRAARKKLHWFSGKTRAYYCLAYCPEHGYIRGKIRIKKTDGHHVFAVKTLRLIDEDGAACIRQMKAEVLEKRREKRQKGSSGCCHTSEHIKEEDVTRVH